MKFKKKIFSSETTEPITTKLSEVIRSFGHLKKFLFLVIAAILDTGRR
jgi:hypothetical protein